MKPLLCATAIFAACGITSAQAGGPVVVTDEPEVAAAPAPVLQWSGFYAGLAVSANTGDYSGSYPGFGNIFPGDGRGDLDGKGIGLLLGYDAQSGNFVFGGELNYAAPGISGSEDCNNPAFACGLDIDSVASLRARVGYLVSPNTLVYATAGVAQARAEAYVDNGGGAIGEKNTVNGVVYGLGAEHQIGTNIRLRGAILRHDFDGKDFQTDAVYENIKSEFTTIELGVIYRF